MSLPPAIEKFFKTISAFFLNLWDWLSSIFDEDKKPAYFVNATYWLKVGQRVTTLLNEADSLLGNFFSPEARAIEQDPRYYQKINSMLEKLSAFARGEVPALETESILENEEDINLLEAFRKKQEAHFILSLVAEMNIEGLDEVYPSGEEKPEDWVTFEKLFEDIRKKTKIKREIFTANVIDDETNLLAENNAEYQFVMFGSNPDGRCIDYCLNMWNREETIKEFVRCLTNLSVEKSRRDALKKAILNWFIANSEAPDLITSKALHKEYVQKSFDADKKVRELSAQYQFEFISEQPKDCDIKAKRIYVWVKDETLFYIFRNEDEEIIKKDIGEIYTYIDNLDDEEFDEKGKACIKLLKETGSHFKDEENKIGNIVRRNLDKKELLSHENIENLIELKQKIKKAREEKDTIAKEITGYNDDEKFAKFVQNNLTNKKWWLTSGLVTSFFSAMPEEARGLMIWKLTSTNKLQFLAHGGNHSSPFHNLHYLSTELHAGRIVKIDDFPQLATGKRYENRFKICQTAEEHQSYMSDWVDKYRPKNGY